MNGNIVPVDTRREELAGNYVKGHISDMVRGINAQRHSPDEVRQSVGSPDWEKEPSI